MVSTSRAAYMEAYSLGQASFTLSSDTTVRISSHAGVLMGVIIDSQSVGGSLTIADAWVSTTGNAVTYSTIAILGLSSGSPLNGLPIYIPFNVNLSSGLTYTTASNTGGVTIIWKSFITPSTGK